MDPDRDPLVRVGNAPSYFLVFIGAVFPVFVNTFSAVRNIDRVQINAALCWVRTRTTDPRRRDSGFAAGDFPGLRIALGVAGCASSRPN
jgi:NitT/TauT family transport system permease protein/sulfonate transport system permease protein